jgi:hypothetical protein
MNEDVSKKKKKQMIRNSSDVYASLKMPSPIQE